MKIQKLYTLQFQWNFSTDNSFFRFSVFAKNNTDSEVKIVIFINEITIFFLQVFTRNDPSANMVALIEFDRGNSMKFLNWRLIYKNQEIIISSQNESEFMLFLKLRIYIFNFRKKHQSVISLGVSATFLSCF